jgi:ParB family chromosome partitioning protein
MRSVSALLVPDDKLAFRILALNTEKAHNLRDRSLEVIRMARQLAKEAPRSKETEHAVTFESPAFLTLGCAYAERSRFAGSSYQPILNKVDRFLDNTLPAALRQREQWAVRLMDDDASDGDEESLPSSGRGGANQSRALRSAIAEEGRSTAHAHGGGAHQDGGQR